MDTKNASLIFVSEKLRIREIFLIINFLIRCLDMMKKTRTAMHVNIFVSRKPKNETSLIKLIFSKMLFKISILHYFVENINRIFIFKTLLR